MEEEKKLYPMVFAPIQAENGEMVQLADLGYEDSEVKNGWLALDSISEVMDMYMDRIVGDEVFAMYGRQFPVGVRTIDVDGRRPLCVSPDDETASERFDFLGKTRLWYILTADKDASVGIGFKRSINAEVLYYSCLDSTVEKYLNILPAKQGDSFLITPGTVFYAKGILKILEVAESSPLDFRICDWGRKKSSDDFDDSLTLEEALDFINYEKQALRAPATKDEGPIKQLAKTEVFASALMDLSNPLDIKNGENGSYTLYSCISGEASIQAKDGDKAENYVFKEGETVLVPAEIGEFLVVPLQKGTRLIETLSPSQSVSEQK